MADIERIARLESVQQQVAAELSSIHKNIEKMSDTNSRHYEKNNQTSSEVNSSLALLAATVTDLKDTTKSLVDSQNKLVNRMAQVDSQNAKIESMHNEFNKVNDRLNALEKLESKIEGSWKMFSAITAAIAFAVSTMISIGVFKMNQPPVQQYHAPTAVELQVDHMIQQQQILKAK